MAASPTYRPDIDGLRALAVAAVVLYHAGVPGFGGGYVGVDIFFVVSGYLITRLLLASAGQAPLRQLAEFYVRRGRRILPALGVTALLAGAAAMLILLPADLARFGRYLAATPLFLSNLVAWRDGGYFNTGLPHAALNHFWSLAVEEQFYLVYPLVLLGIARYLPRYRVAALVGLAACSLVLCVWASHRWPMSNYYLAPSRAWQLLLGALVASGASGALKNRLVNEAGAAVSLLAIGFTFHGYGPDPQYPGLRALAPCLATAGLIVSGCGQATAVARLLSLRPLVFTGLISYSLYLWHWPILSLFNYYRIEPPGALTSALWVVAIYAVAWASWQFIETPVRRRTFLPSTRGFVLAAVVLNVLLLATGVAFWKSGGFPARFSAEVQTLADVRGVLHRDALPCMHLSLEKIRAGALCRYGPQGPAAQRLPKVVVWGDSHAMALMPAYEKLAQSHRVQLYFASASACGPLLDVGTRAGPQRLRTACEKFNAAMFEAVRRLDPRLVILNGYWSFISADLAPRVDLTGSANESLFKRAMEHTVRRIGAGDHSVCVVLDVPELKYDPPYALAMARRRGIAPDFIALSRAQAQEQSRNVESDIRALEARDLLRIADPKEALCRDGTCAFEIDGQLLYRDSNHLSIAGADFVATSLDACFAGKR